MTEYVEPVEVAGDFADLGLESDSITPPSDFPIGTHRGFVSNIRFVQKKDDASKKNIEITYKVYEPGVSSHGMEKREVKAANPSDSEMTKRFLKGRLMDLGVKAEEIPVLNIKTLIGTQVYFTVNFQKNNPQYTNVTKVVLDNDAEPLSDEQVASNVPLPNTSAAVSADDLPY